jgi:hypothetical protein
VGVTLSPAWDNRVARLILGESGRSVFRAAYGLFYDFGAFAGSSAAALFQATYPPFSTDRRFNFTPFTGTKGSFEAPLSTIPPPTTASIRNSVVTYPIQVFDPNFENARAHHWTVGWQRLLPSRVLLSAVYVGTQSLRLQRQAELNVFERNAILPFAFIGGMRKFSQYSDIRQFESSRATRYLSEGLAFDTSYTYSQANDNGSVGLGDALNTELWSRSDFYRPHMISASWFYRVRLSPGLRDKIPWADLWQWSGTWRYRSGIPLDIRQTQDPTFSFIRIGRPDIVGEFQQLDPSEIRTFTLPSGITQTGRFAFDPTVFQPVEPTDFDELRPGTVQRNQFPSHSFQQWDMRFARPIAVSEVLSATVGFDILNVFGNKNWALPFRNVDHPYFGIVRTEGLGRTFQLNARFTF